MTQPIFFKVDDKHFICVQQMSGSIARVWKAYKLQQKPPDTLLEQYEEKDYTFLQNDQETYQTASSWQPGESLDGTWVALRFPNSDTNGEAIKKEAQTLEALKDKVGESGRIKARAVRLLLDKTRDSQQPFLVVEWAPGEELKGIQGTPDLAQLHTAYHKFVALLKFTEQAARKSQYLTDSLKPQSINGDEEQLYVFDFNVVGTGSSGLLQSGLPLLGKTGYYLLTGQTIKEPTGKIIGYTAANWPHIPWQVREWLFNFLQPHSCDREQSIENYITSKIETLKKITASLDIEPLQKLQETTLDADTLHYYDLAKLENKIVKPEDSDKYKKSLYAILRTLNLNSHNDLDRERAWAMLGGVLPRSDGADDPTLRAAWLLRLALDIDPSQKFIEVVVPVWEKLGKNEFSIEPLEEYRDSNSAIRALCFEKDLQDDLAKDTITAEELRGKRDDLKTTLENCADEWKKPDFSSDSKKTWQTLLGETWFTALEKRVQSKVDAAKLLQAVRELLNKETFVFGELKEKLGGSALPSDLEPVKVLVDAISCEKSSPESWRPAITTIFGSSAQDTELVSQARAKLRPHVVAQVNEFTCNYLIEKAEHLRDLFKLQTTLKKSLDQVGDLEREAADYLYTGLQELNSILDDMNKGELVTAAERARNTTFSRLEVSGNVQEAWERWLSFLTKEIQTRRETQSTNAPQKALERLKEDTSLDENLQQAAVILQGAFNNNPLSTTLEKQLAALRAFQAGKEAWEAKNFSAAHEACAQAIAQWAELKDIVAIHIASLEALDVCRYLDAEHSLTDKQKTQLKSCIFEKSPENLNALIGKIDPDAERIVDAILIVAAVEDDDSGKIDLDTKPTVDAVSAFDDLITKLYKNFAQPQGVSLQLQRLIKTLIEEKERYDPPTPADTHAIEQMEHLRNGVRGIELKMWEEARDGFSKVEAFPSEEILPQDVKEAIIPLLQDRLIPALIERGEAQAARQLGEKFSVLSGQPQANALQERGAALLTQLNAAYQTRDPGPWWRFRKTEFPTEELNALRFIENKIKPARNPAINARNIAESIFKKQQLDDTKKSLLPSQYWEVIQALIERKKKTKTRLRWLGGIVLVVALALALIPNPIRTWVLRTSPSTPAPTVEAPALPLGGELHIMPPQARAGGAELWYTVTVTNTGEVTTTNRLALSAAEDLRWDPSPEHFTLLPDASQAFTLIRTLRPPTYASPPVTVTLAVSGPQPQQLVSHTLALAPLAAPPVRVAMEREEWVRGRDLQAAGNFTPTVSGNFLVACQALDGVSPPFPQSSILLDASQIHTFSCTLDFPEAPPAGDWRVSIFPLPDSQQGWQPHGVESVSPYSVTFTVRLPEYVLHLSPEPELLFDTPGASVGALHALWNMGEVPADFTVEWLEATNITQIALGVTLVEAGRPLEEGTRSLTHTVTLSQEAGQQLLLPAGATLAPCEDRELPCPLLRLAFVVTNESAVTANNPANVRLRFCMKEEAYCEDISLRWVAFSEAPAPDWLYAPAQ